MKQINKIFWGTLFGSILMSSTVLSQQPSMIGRFYGGDKAESGEAIATMPDNGYVVAGHIGSFGRRGQDVWVLRFDTNGLISWSTVVPDLKDSLVTSVVATSDNGVLVVGVTNARKSLDGAISVDVKAQAFAAKIDAEGSVLWTKKYANATNGGRLVINSAAQNKLGQAVLVGGAEAQRDQDWNAILITIDKNGNEVGRKIWAESGDALLNTITTDGGNGWVLGGTNNKNGSFDAWVALIDDKANITWQKTWGAANTDVALSVQGAPGGGYAVLTQMDGSASGSGYPVVLRIGKDGSELGKVEIKNTNKIAHALALLPDNGFVVVGRQQDAGNSNGWVARYTLNGNEVWSRMVGGEEYDEFNGVTSSANGVAIIGSYQPADMVSGQDLWVLEQGIDGTPNGWETKKLSDQANKFLKTVSIGLGNRQVYPLVGLDIINLQLAGQIEALEHNGRLEVRFPGLQLYPGYQTAGVDFGTIHLQALLNAPNQDILPITAKLSKNILFHGGTHDIWGMLGKQEIKVDWHTRLNIPTRFYVLLEDFSFIDRFGGMTLGKFKADVTYSKVGEATWAGKGDVSVGPVRIMMGNQEVFNLDSIETVMREAGDTEEAILARQELNEIIKNLALAKSQDGMRALVKQLTTKIQLMWPATYQSDGQIKVSGLRVLSGNPNRPIGKLGNFTMDIKIPLSADINRRGFDIGVSFQDMLLPNRDAPNMPIIVGDFSAGIGIGGLRLDYAAEVLEAYLLSKLGVEASPEVRTKIFELVSDLSFRLSANNVVKPEMANQSTSVDSLSTKLVMSDLDQELAKIVFDYQHKNLKSPNADLPQEFFPYNLSGQIALDRVPFKALIENLSFVPFTDEVVIGMFGKAGTVMSLKDILLEMAVADYKINGAVKANQDAFLGVTLDVNWIVNNFSRLVDALVKIAGRGDAQEAKSFLELLRSFGKQVNNDQYQFNVILNEEAQILINNKPFPLFGQ
ncbi:MAG: hypothetical protein JNK86_05185 [Alphaproteobacteria bacterium]|nr:hypothetical protein [Alphaproteobacteria bacterium]